MRQVLNIANYGVLGGALYVLFACGSAPRSSREPAPDIAPAVAPPLMHSFEVDTGYGTLSFRGRIDQTDAGSEFEYRTDIDITFHRDARFNRTLAVDLRECRMVASVPPTETGPWHVLHQESLPISIRLTEDGQTAHLPELRFRLPKAIAAKAHHVGLAVTDGHLMWPVAVELK